jgi:hypothetical protein
MNKKLFLAIAIALLCISSSATQQSISHQDRLNARTALKAYGCNESVAKEIELICYFYAQNSSDYENRLQSALLSFQEIQDLPSTEEEMEEDAPYFQKYEISFVHGVPGELTYDKHMFDEYLPKTNILGVKIQRIGDRYEKLKELMEKLSQYDEDHEAQVEALYVACGRALPWDVLAEEFEKTKINASFDDVRIGHYMMGAKTPDFAYNNAWCFHDASNPAKGLRFILAVNVIGNRYLDARQIEPNEISNVLTREVGAFIYTVLSFQAPVVFLPYQDLFAINRVLSVGCRGDCVHGKTALLPTDKYNVLLEAFAFPEAAFPGLSSLANLCEDPDSMELLSSPSSGSDNSLEQEMLSTDIE